jgi:hypothetical protein
MLTEDEWLEVARKLAKLSQSGQIAWSVLEQRGTHDATYRSRVGELTEYRVWARDADGRVPLRFAIMRAPSPGEEPQSVDAYETASFDLGDGSTSDWVYDVYVAAGRSATGSPQLVAKLLAELEAVNPNSDDF